MSFSTFLQSMLAAYACANAGNVCEFSRPE